MRSRTTALVFAVSSLVLSLTLSADSRSVPPPVNYGPPDDTASRVPPPGASFLPGEPGARREVLENLSTSLLPPFASTKRSVAGQVESEAEAGGRSIPWSFETEALIVEPVTTVATDIRGVEEPVIINLVKLGATHTLTGFIRRLQEESGVAFQVRNEWSYRSSDGVTSGGLLPLPAGYTDSADPVFAHNGTTGGVAPERTYMAGLTLNRAGPPNFPSANPTSIRVWTSVNGGSSWTSSGSEVDVIASGTTSTLDKPWIAVSETGSTTGFVYVAWVRFDTSGAGLNELMFRRSRNGISKAHAVCCFPPTWDSSVRITELGRVQGPQIVVDSSGFVYIIFVDSGTRQMRIARSRFAGANVPSDSSSVFAPAQTIATYNRVNTSLLTNFIFGTRTRAVPLPAARYNAATNEILVT